MSDHHLDTIRLAMVDLRGHRDQLLRRAQRRATRMRADLHQTPTRLVAVDVARRCEHLSIEFDVPVDQAAADALHDALGGTQ